MGPDMSGNAMVSEMGNHIDKKLESERRALSSGICGESRSGSHVHHVPFIQGKALVAFEIFIYFHGQRFRIRNLFRIVVDILESSHVLVIIERSRFSVFRTYFLYSETIPLVDSAYLCEREVSKFLFPFEHH